MVTKFDSSYYGAVNMKDLSYTGTPINNRRYSNPELAGSLSKSVV
jgi:hypothetical protein